MHCLVTTVEAQRDTRGSKPTTPPAEYQTLSDEELALRARTEKSAFSELGRRHYRVALRTAMAILRSPEDAEDAVQNSLFKAFTHISDFQFRATFRSWFIGIVINQSLISLRRSKRVQHIPVEPVKTCESRGLGELKSGCKTPEEIHYEQELTGLLANTIKRLPAVFRPVLTMQISDGPDIKTIAGSLHVTPGAAKSRLQRARRELRHRIESDLTTIYSMSSVSLRR